MPGPIPCQIAFAYAHAMPRAGPGRPAHVPPHVRGPWGLRPRGREGAVRTGPSEKAYIAHGEEAAVGKRPPAVGKGDVWAHCSEHLHSRRELG